ncbi:hypothetical protein F5Y13DRAFT_78341 [Hypoxylon sp. FL1857]|nr:hypothetical protein F5Y13DRAFT_78341 [Hypoxylon sp. FL1857]
MQLDSGWRVGRSFVGGLKSSLQPRTPRYIVPGEVYINTQICSLLFTCVFSLTHEVTRLVVRSFLFLFLFSRPISIATFYWDFTGYLGRLTFPHCITFH